jgi:hypothetical protein
MGDPDALQRLNDEYPSGTLGGFKSNPARNDFVGQTYTMDIIVVRALRILACNLQGVTVGNEMGRR